MDPTMKAPVITKETIAGFFRDANKAENTIEDFAQPASLEGKIEVVTPHDVDRKTIERIKERLDGLRSFRGR